MRTTLLLKLLIVNLPAIFVAMGVVWVAIDILAADYFTTLMEEYSISPADTHAMFVDAVHRYMLSAIAVAVGLAILLSFVLTRQVLKPLRAMQDATQRLSDGDYDARVAVTTRDELAELAHALNSMADSLAHTEELRRRLVADVAHELRTPLTNLRGYLEGFADGVVAPSPATLDMLHSEVVRLERLVDDLHQLSQVDASEIELRLEDIDLSHLVDRLVALQRSTIEARELSFKIMISPDARRLTADPDKLSQILRNLLENACRFTPVGGKVRISSKGEGARHLIEVANTGPGIAPDDMSRIFERFYRAEKSRSRERGGAGIGLAIVKGLAEAHGGTVGAESREGWTRIWVKLPRLAAQAHRVTRE
ncbi:MAG: HAMP domain-containing protein [Pararhodobacter sp.]|nr:HAMP domain-containing protein [Pararhodobacter sp.]